jgi:hypothetical protein
LPNPPLINEPAKRVDMISIPSKGICGEDDFRYRREKKARTSGVYGRISQAKNGRYDPDNATSASHRFPMICSGI